MTEIASHRGGTLLWPENSRLALHHAPAGRAGRVRRAFGLGIGGWASNDDDAIVRLLDVAVDVFTTGQPDLALKCPTEKKA